MIRGWSCGREERTVLGRARLRHRGRSDTGSNQRVKTLVKSEGIGCNEEADGQAHRGSRALCLRAHP